MSDQDQTAAHVAERAGLELEQATATLGRAHLAFERAQATHELANSQLDLAQTYWREALASEQRSLILVRRSNRLVWASAALLFVVLVLTVRWWW